MLKMQIFAFLSILGVPPLIKTNIRHLYGISCWYFDILINFIYF